MSAARQQRILSWDDPYDVISPCGKYRYLYGQRFRETGPIAVFLMLNPSTGTAEKTDATLRKCFGFARRWHCAAVEVVNLFAYRSRDPSQLLRVEDPIGPENDEAILTAVEKQRSPSITVAAWGFARYRLVEARAAEVLDALRAGNGRRRIMAVRLCNNGDPAHPLYVPYSAELVEVPRAEDQPRGIQTSGKGDGPDADREGALEVRRPELP